MTGIAKLCPKIIKSVFFNNANFWLQMTKIRE